MTITRRYVIGMGGGIVAALSLPRRMAMAQDAIDISMAGRPNGSRVWFDPIGILVEPGQTVRWTNHDPGNSHTATAYHPMFEDRPLRIPDDAQPWDSGYLLPGDSFSVTLTVPGVYDYYCIPHEMAGMVGRIVVGEPPQGWTETTRAGEDLPDAALLEFPSVEEIMEKGVVRRG
jgi:plastocyanin